MKNKEIEKMAKAIAELEREICHLGKNAQENQQKIENMMASLSLEEMLQIDDFIFVNKLLTR